MINLNEKARKACAELSSTVRLRTDESLAVFGQSDESMVVEFRRHPRALPIQIVTAALAAPAMSAYNAVTTHPNSVRPPGASVWRARRKRHRKAQARARRRTR